jgi:hypothetical protein
MCSLNETAAEFRGKRWRRIFAVACLCAAAGSSFSCHRGNKTVAQPPTATVVATPPSMNPGGTQPAVTAPSAANPTLASYEAAEQAFEAGRYPEAVKGYESYLKFITSENQDRVHFRLGLAYALMTNVPQNMKIARTHFQVLDKDFQNSPYRVPAELILSLLNMIDKLNNNIKELGASNRELGASNRELNAAFKEQQGKIKQLSEELQRLKAIDMKRSPSRPPR